MAYSPAIRSILGGKPRRRSGGRVKTSTKKTRPAGGKAKLKLKVKGTPEQVKDAVKTLAKGI